MAGVAMALFNGWDPSLLTIRKEVFHTLAKNVEDYLPSEFRRMPMLLPPDMDDAHNPDHLWMVCEDWRAPAIGGKQVCVRGPIVLANGSVFGFFTDGISVPQLAWSVFDLSPFSMPELCGALGHDVAYAAELVTRDTCDLWLREWEKMVKVSMFRRNTMYGVVRSLGWGVWNKHTRESIEAARLMCQLVDEGKTPMWPELTGKMIPAFEQ